MSNRVKHNEENLLEKILVQNFHVRFDCSQNSSHENSIVTYEEMTISCLRGRGLNQRVIIE